jgi:iron complex outermembrane receptor protein
VAAQEKVTNQIAEPERSNEDGGNMMKTSHSATASRLALLGLPVALFATAALAEAPPAASVRSSAAATDSSQATTIGEIIVTATRRQTSLRRTAASISVLDGTTQREKGLQGLENLQSSVPNVNFNATSNESQIYIRGVGNTFINAGGDPGVAFYQDGAYISDQRTTNTGQFDVARVEVLRGAQGALYGRNAVGGAINVIAAQPEDTPHASVSVLVGDYGRAESEGYITGPLGLADTDVRISFQVRTLDGYTKNQLAGQPGAPDRLDDLGSQAIRFQTLTNLPGGGRLRLQYTHYRESENGPALAVTPQAGVEYPQEALDGATPSDDPRSVRANVGGLKLQVDTVNGSYVQPIGRETLSVLANYRRGDQTFLNDCDGSAVNDCRYFTGTRSTDYFGDVHLASPDGDRFRWLVGATYSRFSVDQLIDVTTTSLLDYLNPTAPPDAGFPFHFTGGGHLEATSSAAYADLRWQLNSMVAFTGQARYSETAKGTTEFQTFPYFGVDLSGFHARLKNTFTPFKIGIEGQLTPDLLLYAHYATANKDGALNLGSLQSTPVRPEEVKSEEAGFKAGFFERRLQVNGAIFNSDYRDLQVSQVVGTVVALSNAPRSRIRGGELEITAIPLEGLRLTGNVGYLDAAFLQFSNGRVIPGAVGGPVLNLAGNKLPNVAPWTASLDASYSFHPASGAKASVDILYEYHDRIFFNEFNDLSNSQGPVGILNLSADIGPEAGTWKVYGYVHNLSNATAATGSTIYSGLLGAEKAVSYAPPRNVGIGFSYSF